MAFLDTLKSLMAQQDLTAYALARKSGVTKQGMYKLLDGSNEPTWETIQKLAIALGVDCTVFRDPGVTVPDLPTLDGPGRPRKEPPAPEVLEKPKRKRKES